MELKEVFEPIINFIKGLQKKETENSKEKAKERLQLVLMQDRASVSPDFFEMMKKEIIEVIKKYIEIDEELLEVQLTRGFENGLEGPALYANIPIKNIKPVAKKIEEKEEEIVEKVENGEIENQVAVEEIVESEKTEINEIEEIKEDVKEVVEESKIETPKAGSKENKVKENSKKKTQSKQGKRKTSKSN